METVEWEEVKTVAKSKEFDVQDTNNGPMFIYYRVWVSPLAHFYIEEQAKKYPKIRRSHVASKIIEDAAQKGITLDQRLEFFAKTELPNTFVDKKKVGV
jgi:hypothetical protein